MSDLRNALQKIDYSAPSIQKAAGAMMKHYDRSPDLAVMEWRNSLQVATNSQLLPLLYVANEVLQNSKRNRGNKFLEAMSPVLGQSLQYICGRDRSSTEKVRRTVKIWGDRRVFSIRYVNELLQGLEPYRPGRNGPPPQPVQLPPPTTLPPTFEGASFSPPSSPSQAHHEDHDAHEKKKQQQRGGVEDQSEEDDIMAILDDKDNGDDDQQGDDHDNNDNNDDDDDDDDGDLFGDNDDDDDGNNGPKLVVDINIESTLDAQNDANHRAATKNATSATKRRRGSAASAGSQQSSHNAANAKRRLTLSSSNLIDVWNQFSMLQQTYLHSQLAISGIQKEMEKLPNDDLGNIVGDELQHAYKQNARQYQTLQEQKGIMYDIATEKHTLEQNVVQYLPWLERALKQDDDDIAFCDQLTSRIQSFRRIHGSIRNARDIRVAEEQKQRELQAEQERRKREAEENERFRKAALAKETEAKPGMVWNPSTREYQSLDTDESWRD